MHKRWVGGVLMGAMLLAACGAADEGAGSAGSALQVNESENGATGSLSGDLSVQFEVARLDADMTELTYHMNGLTFVVTVDRQVGAVMTDGFGSDNGGETTIRPADQQTLLALAHALDELGPQVSPSIELLRSMTSTMAEYPTGMELHQLVPISKARAYVSICGYLNNYREAWHDCGSGSYGSATTSIDNAYVSMDAAGSCSDGTYFWTTSWVCYEPDHVGEWAYGACFGRCGAGCGSGTQFTDDCLDHDGCVRYGHVLASPYCNNEFSWTVDDAASAPNCL